MYVIYLLLPGCSCCDQWGVWRVVQHEVRDNVRKALSSPSESIWMVPGTWDDVF